MTHVVLNTLQANTFLTTVPANVTYLFQPLDVYSSPNANVKHFVKNKFCERYSSQITHTRDEGQGMKAIDIPL